MELGTRKGLADCEHLNIIIIEHRHNLQYYLTFVRRKSYF